MSNEEVTRCPIRRWTLANFKSVEEADLEFAPLTILVGANSSGKSSLLQSILLIVHASQEGAGTRLPLNGPLVELGDVADVVFAGAPSVEEDAGTVRKKRSSFRIGAEFDFDGTSRPGLDPAPPPEGERSESRASWDATFGLISGEKGLGVAGISSTNLGLALPGEREAWSFRSTGIRRTALEVVAAARFLGVQGDVLPLRGYLNKRFEPGQQRLFRFGADSPPLPERRTAGLMHVGGIPIQFLSETDRVQFEAWDILERFERDSYRQATAEAMDQGRTLTPNERKKAEADVAREIVLQLEERLSTPRRRPRRPSAELTPLLLGLTRDQRERIVSAVQKLVSKGAKVLAPLERRMGVPFGLERVGSTLSTFLARNVRYLGPLREEPRIVYLPTPGELPGSVGKKGEKALALLHAHEAAQVACFYPDGRPPSRCSLAEAVKFWLKTFEIAEGIDTEVRPRLGLEPHLKLPDVGRTLDMTAVGVGVSQIFPVLVMGLHSPPGTVLLMEQPELHLHPALQQRLGDFLLACARSGRQLIVETHSDHLISRLRRRIAEDETDELRKSLAIIFAERRAGRTSYRHVAVNRFGGIEEWPQGFFDQAAKESQLIIRAGLAKKKQESETPPGPDQTR